MHFTKRREKKTKQTEAVGGNGHNTKLQRKKKLLKSTGAHTLLYLKIWEHVSITKAQ